MPAPAFVHLCLSPLSQSSGFPRAKAAEGLVCCRHQPGPSPEGWQQSCSGNNLLSKARETCWGQPHTLNAMSCLHTRSCTQYLSSKWDSCSFTCMGTGFGPQFNIQQITWLYLMITKTKPQKPWNKLATATGPSGRPETIRLWRPKKAVREKCFLLHTRTNAGCDVCLVLLIYFCRNLQLGVCTFWRYHACIASECFYTISSLSNKFIHSIHKSRM